MVKSLRIYVAGPYSPGECDTHSAVALATRNTESAIEIGIEIFKKGHVAFIPHLSHYVHINKNCPLDLPWYTIDNTFLDNWAEAIYYMSPSKGADAELKRAKDLGLKVFYNLNEIPEMRE